jgi:hypothetical protein
VNDPRLVELERQRWVPGQLLRSRDLRDRLATSEQLRLWHNRAAHAAFGVARGLEVTLGGPPPSVTVQPGVAYDCLGRPLALLAPRSLPLPAGPTPSTLVARARAGGTEPELVWLGPRPDPRDGAPIARLTFPGGTPTLAPAPAGARRLAGPRVAWGSTQPEGTAWQPWLVPDFPEADKPPRLFPVGVQVTVDTGAAGFTDVPCYFAWLQWPQVGSTQLDYRFYALLALQYVEEPATDRFVFRAALPAELRRGGDRTAPGEELVGFAAGQRLYVCWLAIRAEDEGTGEGPNE